MVSSGGRLDPLQLRFLETLAAVVVDLISELTEPAHFAEVKERKECIIANAMAAVKDLFNQGQSI